MLIGFNALGIAAPLAAARRELMRKGMADKVLGPI